MFSSRRRHQIMSATANRWKLQVVVLTVILAAALFGTLKYYATQRDAADANDDDIDDDDQVPYGGYEVRHGGYRPEAERRDLRRSFAKNCTSFDTTAGMYRQVELDDVRLRGQSSLAHASAELPPSQTADDTAPFARVIHRMWKTTTVPEAWKSGVSSCQELNPDWLYCHWTDDELSAFIATEFPDFRSTYDAYPYSIQRADAARYILLYRYAGVYLDLDIKCKLSFDDIFSDVGNKVESLSLADSDVLLAEAEPFGVVSDFIAVRRRHDPFMRHVIAGLRRSAETWYPLPYVTVMFGTGPVYLSRRVRDFNEKTAEKRFSSASFRSSRTSRVSVIPTPLYNGAYFGHLSGGTWHSWDGRIIWTAYRLRYRLLKMDMFILLCVAIILCLVRRNRRGLSTRWRML